MEAANAVEVFHSIGQRSLSLTYPGRLDNHPCLIRPLRIPATSIFCFCHMDALDEVLCALSIFGVKCPDTSTGKSVSRTSRRKNENYVPSMCIRLTVAPVLALWVAVNKEEKVKNFPASNSHVERKTPPISIFFSVGAAHFKSEQILPEKCHSVFYLTTHFEPSPK
jgi:hypothetical protein